MSQYGVAGTIMSGLCYVVYKLVNKLIADKDEQIRRLTEENEKYKVKFIGLLDKLHSVSPEADNRR